MFRNMFKATVWLTLSVGLILPSPTQARKTRFEIGEGVPAFTLRALNGKEIKRSYVTLEHHFGPDARDPKKATIISFFATYCKPCKKEIPFLAALYDTYGSDGLQVLLVSIDKEKAKLNEAAELAQKADVKFPVLGDRFNIVARRYFIEKLPCLYILDRNGKVAFVNIGYGEDAGNILFEKVRRILGIDKNAPVPAAMQAYLENEGD